MVPSAVRARQALRPSQVSGTFTVTFLAILARARPSRSIPARSVAATSALTGPATAAQISAMISRKSRLALATSDGLVVTPSTRPVAANSLISATSAVSTKNFIAAFSTLFVRVPERVRLTFAPTWRLGYTLDSPLSPSLAGSPFGQPVRTARGTPACVPRAGAMRARAAARGAGSDLRLPVAGRSRRGAGQLRAGAVRPAEPHRRGVGCPLR